MLVLARTVNRGVIITVGTVRIRVVLIDQGKPGRASRLGFEAPPEVTINREEVEEQIQLGSPRRRKPPEGP